MHRPSFFIHFIENLPVYKVVDRISRVGYNDIIKVKSG